MTVSELLALITEGLENGGLIIDSPVATKLDGELHPVVGAAIVNGHLILRAL